MVGNSIPVLRVANFRGVPHVQPQLPPISNPSVMSFKGLAQREVAQAILQSEARDVTREIVRQNVREKGLLSLFERISARFATRAPVAGLAAADEVLPIIDTILLMGGVWVIADEVSKHLFKSQLRNEIKFPGVNTSLYAFFPSHERKSAIQEPPTIDKKPRLDPEIDPNIMVIDPSADVLSEVFLMSGTEEPDGGTKAGEAGEAPKPEGARVHSVEVAPRIFLQDLLKRYGPGILKEEKTNAPPTTALNFRVAGEERIIIEDFSKAHNITLTLSIRIAIRMLLDTMEGENLIRQYGGEIVSVSRRPGYGTKMVSLRVSSSEKAGLKDFSQGQNITVTLAMKLAIRLLRDRLNLNSAVKSPAPSLTMEASQSPFFPVEFTEIVSKKLGEGITHIQRSGDNTVIVMTESGAVYEAKCKVVYEHIELRKMTPEKKE